MTPYDPLAAPIAAARADLDAQEPEVALLRALAAASDGRPRERAGLLARLMRRQYVAGRLAGLETAQRMGEHNASGDAIVADLLAAHERGDITLTPLHELIGDDEDLVDGVEVEEAIGNG